ncbi:MAG TPA: NUDIX hydrolase, partial [Candidatus Paceibacterota bacterium]|nr:NUDIX hydrolase [Candidatus Paceibacterota bacterium]
MEPELSSKEIHSTITGVSGVTLPVIYRDIDTEDELGERHITGVHAYCFYQDKLLVVFSEEKGYWTPAGGGVEEGESAQDAAFREVHEESNMKVLSHRFIGYQDIIWPDHIETQTRSV